MNVLFIASLSAKVSFEKEIKVIFEKRCISCHRKAFKEKKRGRIRTRKPRGGIQFDDKKKALAFKKKAKKLFDLKNPKESLIYKAITLPENHDDIMPPKGDKLTKIQISNILNWIKEGANWPNKFKFIKFVPKKK